MNYREHLISVDKKIEAALGQATLVIKKQQNIPLKLVISIMSQQLSTRVAAVFHQRFLQLFEVSSPDAFAISQIPYATLRSIGLSHAKANYVHNVAAFCIEHNITDATLEHLSNEEIIQLLTQIKGVGKWTVEMLLMFGLGREDVFPVDDLVIRQAMISIYKPRYKTTKDLYARLEKIAAKWKPYRTYACMHLWRYKDGD